MGLECLHIVLIVMFELWSVQDAGIEAVWHRVLLRRFTDTDTGAQLLLLQQSDISEEVRS